MFIENDTEYERLLYFNMLLNNNPLNVIKKDSSERRIFNLKDNDVNTNKGTDCITIK